MTNPISAVPLPKELELIREELLAAAEIHNDDPQGEWPEGVKLAAAFAPQAIAESLIPKLHAHLVDVPIAYVWREAIKRRDRTILGRAATAGGRLNYFSGMDFVIDFNWEQWSDLTTLQRIALVDHELSHCGPDGMVSHDLEEFRSIVERWGLWQPDVAAFANSVRGIA